MDKPGLRDALPQPRQSDTRNDPFWSSLDSSLSATTPQPSEPVAKRDLDVGLGDVARGVGAGALDLVGGIGELARQASNFGKENAGKQGGDYLEQARANMANKLSPLLDVVAGAGDLAASGAESLNDGMSADAKEALGRRLVDETPEGRLTLGDGAGDIDVWAMKMAQGVGSLLPTLAAGGVTGVAAKASIGRAVTASMIKRGATQEVAEAVAAKAVSKIATGAAVTTGTTGSVGSAGVNTRDTVLGMSFDELSRSDTFRQAFTRIDQDQQTQHLSDEEKLSLAREETANVASRATMSDAKVWGAAAVGSMMGDAMLFKMLAGKAATGGVLKGTAKGAAGEGISETLEEGVQQYAVNESLNEVAAADIDPMKGVMSSAIEGGLIGMGTGGAVGAVGGARGGKHASQEDGVGTDPVAEPSAPVTEGAAGPAVDPNFASVPLEDGEQAPSASQAEGELNPLGPSASQFPGVFERDQRGILRVKGDVDVLASWAEQADMPYITDGDGIAIPAKYAKQAEKAIKGYRPVAAEPMAEAAPADMLAFSQVDPIEHEPAIKRQGFVMRNGDGQSTGEPEPYVRPQSGDELLYESSANWQAGQPHAESAPVDLEALRKESAQRWRDGNKPEAGTPVRTEEDTEQALNALRAEGVNGWAGRQDPKLDMPKGQEFIPHGPQAGLPAVVGDGVQQAAGKAKGLPLSDTIFAGGPSHGGQADNTNYARPHLSRDQVDSTLGEESIRDPRSPVRQSIAKAGSATDSVFGPLRTLRITRKGKPFASEKEAAMASRKGKEIPVPLNGGGFGVAEIAEVEQVRTEQPTPSQPQQLAPAVDTGYRDVIPSSEQSEVTHGQPTPIPAISSERPGDQPGAGDPVATGVGQTPAELAERAGPGDPADGASLAPVPVTQPGEENALTAPAPAGVAVSEEVQPEQARTTAGPAAAPTPWSGMIDNPDGTITLEGEVAALKSWAKDNGVKAIPGKGGLVVSTTSVAKVRQLTTPATSEPVRQIEAARAEIAPEPTEAQKEAGNYKKGHIKLQGLDIALENPKGSTRSGTDQDGKAWQSTMTHDYGYIKRTLGADGDHVDVFIGDKPDSETVYVVDQVDPITGKFDEHKVMMGFSDEQAAREGYLGNYEAGWKGLGAIKAMPVESFKRWVKEGDTTKPADSMESEPVDANALADEEAIAVADELGIEHGDNPDDARWGLDGIKADVLAAAVGRVRNPGEPVAIKRPLDNPNIVAAPPMEGDPVTRAKKVRMSQQREGGYEGLSVDEATRIVDDFLADFNGNIPLKPFIREKVSEIYRNVADDSDTARTTKGAYHPSADLFTVVAGNARGTVSGSPALRLQKGRLRESVELGAKADLLKTLRHELLGHYGLDTFAPEDKRALLQKLIAAQKEPWLAPAWRHASNLGDQLDAIKEHERELAVAEEAFARLAERELPSRAIQTWNDIKATFSRLLRKIGLVKGPIKEHELDSLIRAVSKGIRNGERTRQNIRGDKEVIGKQADEPAKDDKPERIIRFSKQAMAQGDKPAKHLTRKEAELVSHGWFKQYRGASGIKVQIHATQAELEGALGLDAKDGLIRRAAFDDDAGTLHVAADTISDPKRMREILRHEVLAHYGLANVLGDGEYTKLMSRLIQSQKDPSMKPVWDWVNTHYADEDIGTQAEEVVAHLAELEQGAWGRGWDRVVAWVTRALRAVGFVPDGITAAETRSLIEGLGKKLQRSGPDDSGPDGGKKFSQEAERPAQKGGIKMSQASTAADAAMEKLNLGPKPDIIDKTKTSLNKLRQVDRGVVSSWVDRVIKKANTEVLDALAPIKYAEEAAGITDAADSGYVAARMATGAASTMQATMLYGLPEWNDGVIQRKAGTGEKDALLGIFADLGADLHNWLGWMAGHRAELLMAQGRENLLDANDIAALKGQGKGKEAKFLDAKARWNRLNAATLDLAQEAGLFTKEARAEFENEWYIPFFRESDDGDVIAPFKTKGIANQNAGIKKLKGGEANTNDLLENIFTSTSKLIDASMKNMAAQKTVWNLADTGIIEVIPKPNKMDYQALANGKDRIMVKLEGEDYMIRVEDPDLYRAMTFFDREPFGAMVNVAAKAKRILTAGITASPEFMLRNFLRDSLSSWAISKDGFKPMIDSIKGVRKTWRMDGSTIDVMFSGASFLGGYVNGNDPEAMADTVRKSLRRKGMTPEQIARYEKSIIRNAAHAKGVVADAWEKYSRVGEAVENGNREAVYDAAIKAGKSHAQAAFESKDLMDFSMLGAARTIQLMSQLLPFFNARIQGLGKLSRELRDNPREIAKRAGMITAASLALLAHNWDDERYEAVKDWDKDANWHFWLGEHHWRIPKPFEIGVLFGTIPERMVRALGDKDSGAQFGKAVARAIGDTFALNPIPQIAKPMVEATVNYNFFQGGPIDGPQDLAVMAGARYDEQTSLLMRELGELTGFSPKQLEHLVIGYTGTMGSYVMAAADGLIRAFRPGESASWRADEIPLVKAVYRGTGPAKSTQHMEEFYRMLNEVNQLKRTVDQYRSEGLTDKARELLEEQGGILKARRSLSRTQQQVRVVRNKIELIQRDRTLAAEEKRQRIDEMLGRRNDLVYQSVKHNRQNWE
ncbi:LPD38 domain-containing protein [Aeromonas caviae]